jgi:ubiquinone/menaquinone biosynthesis C-methylase UbiE
MLRQEKANVRRFYDTFGWSKDATGTYNDTASFVDLRTVLSRYYHQTQMRVSKYLRPSGEYFLDAGSGPLSQPEYLTYSGGYAHRVCVDLSATALRQVRSRLGSHALCVVGDLVHLPFGKGVFDAVLASHVLYHIPEDEQLSAIHELYRTTKEGATCVIVYMWPTSSITRLGELIDKQAAPAARPAQAQLLYFQPRDHRWLTSALPADWSVDIRSWRSVDRTFSRAFVAENVVGAALLRLMYFLEERLPHLMGRLGRYPLIVIRR